MLRSPATAVKWEIIFNVTWKKAVLLPMSTQILPGSSGHSFYSFPPSPIPFQKVYKQSYTHIISSRYLDHVSVTGVSQPHDLASQPQPPGANKNMIHCSQQCLDTFLQNTTVQKGARAPLRKMKEKCHLHGFLQITFTAPPACSKSPLLPPGQKKEKPQKLIKTENKPFRSHSFEHILVFLSKTHHSTINHKSP